MDDQPYKARREANLPPYKKASLTGLHLSFSWTRLVVRLVALLPQLEVEGRLAGGWRGRGG